MYQHIVASGVAPKIDAITIDRAFAVAHRVLVGWPTINGQNFVATFIN